MEALVVEGSKSPTGQPYEREHGNGVWQTDVQLPI